jgi:thioester reductase-like protein
MSDSLLLTGATGFLGMELIARWLEDDDGPDVFVPVRARDDAGARERIDQLLGCLYEKPPAGAGRLRPVRGDLTAPGLGLSAHDRAVIARSVERVVHCAASVSFSLPIEDARAINVGGTAEVLSLARGIAGLERLVHVSTAYVAGRSLGVFREADLLHNAPFRNTYEQTKHEAECLVAASTDLPLVTVRPSIVVGESDSGWTSAFNVIYQPLKAFVRGHLRALPADPLGLVDIVPVDHVADVLHAATFTPAIRGTFGATAGDRAVALGELVDLISTSLHRAPPRLTRSGDLPRRAAMFAPYFDVACRFDDQRTVALLGHHAPPTDDYLAAVLRYGQIADWGRRPLTRQAARALIPLAA